MNEMLNETLTAMVQLVSENPEMALCMSVISTMSVMLNLMVFVKRMCSSKPVTKTETVEVVKKVFQPYIPAKTVLNLIELLNNQEDSWVTEGAKNALPKNWKMLHFDKMTIYRHPDFTKEDGTQGKGNLDVYCDGTKLDIEKMFVGWRDRNLLRQHFDARWEKENIKNSVRKADMEAKAQADASAKIKETWKKTNEYLEKLNRA